MLADGGHDRLQCRLGRVVPQSQATGRDATLGLDMSGLDTEHSRPGEGQTAHVNEMPGGGGAILRRVLTHGRDHDPVRKRETAQPERGEQCCHGLVIICVKSVCLKHSTGCGLRCAFANNVAPWSAASVKAATRAHSKSGNNSPACTAARRQSAIACSSSASITTIRWRKASLCSLASAMKLPNRQPLRIPVALSRLVLA